MSAWNHKVVSLALLSALGTACNTAGTPVAEPDGEVLFTNYCAPCHGAGGQGTRAIEAPSLAGLPAWYVEAQVVKFRTGVRGAHFDDIAGLRMRPMSRTLVSDAEIAAVATFVASLPPQRPAPVLDAEEEEKRAHHVADTFPPADADHGKTLFTACAACHGADAMGNQTMNAPPLVYASDWYLLTQLRHFKSEVRGAEPRDVTGKQMAPMAAMLADEQAMRDVIAYVGTLPAPGVTAAATHAPAGH